MIPLNQEQRLGQKAYLLIASRKMSPGIIMLLVSAILLTLKGSIIALASAAGVAALTTISSVVADTILALFIISLIILLVGIIIARFVYSNYTYTFEEFDLRMRRGILHQTVTTLPYRQIQDIDIDRSVLLRLLGLSKLSIITAGHEESDEHGEVEVILEPIEKDVAEDIRQMLERKIGVQVVKTVQEADSEMIAKAPDDPATALKES